MQFTHGIMAGEAQNVQMAGYPFGCRRLKAWNVQRCLVEFVRIFDKKSSTYKCRE